MSINGTNSSPLRIPDFAPDELNFLESVEAAHSSHSFAARIAHFLDIKKEPTRMDSQAKYCALARGDGGVYVRMPTGVGYIEKIWVRRQRPACTRKVD
jgi:3'(2'), 5'-bisphosphate nucleotidase